MDVFTITEMKYLIESLFGDFVRPLLYLFLRCKVVWLRYLPGYGRATKVSMPSTKLLTVFF